MSDLKVDRLFNEIDWSQVSPQALDLAIREFKVRVDYAREMQNRYTEEELLSYAHGTPVVFARKKHAFQITLADAYDVSHPSYFLVDRTVKEVSDVK